MKKLMIGMLAAGAAIASAWADAENTKLNSETFDNLEAFTLGNYWKYSKEAIGDGEVVLTAEGDGKFLQLNTGTNKLTRGVNASCSADTLTDLEAIYFDSKVKFEAASDTIPTLGDDDKLALFVLDNSDYVSSDASTGLYVLGGFKDGDNIVPRLYKLAADVDVTDWTQVSIKTYKTIKTGTPLQGFVVSINGDIAPVSAAYAMVNGEPDFSNNLLNDATAAYLGIARDEVSTAIATTRYGTTQDSHQLILSLEDEDATVTGVDFMGKGGIDDLAFDTKDNYGFGEDAQLFMIDAVAGVASVKDSEGNVVTQLIADKSTTNLTVVLKPGFYYGGATDEVTINVTLNAGGKLSDVLNDDNLFEPVAIAGSTQYKDAATFAEAAQNQELEGDVKLIKPVDMTLEDSTQVFIATALTFDLNGKTLTTDGFYATAAVEITDSATEGKIVGLVEVSEGGSITINAGIFDGTVTGASIPVDSTAKFLATDNAADDLVAMLTGRDATKNYAFVPDGDYLVLQVTAVQNDVELAPGASTEVVAADQTAANAIADKVKVTVSEEFKDDLEAAGVSVDAYTQLFKGKATATENGKYVITLELAPQVKIDVQKAVNDAVTAVANALTDTAATSVAVDTKPGLFYGLVKKAALGDMKDAKPAADAWQIGTGESLTFTLDKTGNSGFFKVICSPTK